MYATYNQNRKFRSAPPAMRRYKYQQDIRDARATLRSTPKSMVFINSAACHKPSPLRHTLPLGTLRFESNRSTPSPPPTSRNSSSSHLFDYSPTQSPASTPGPATPRFEFSSFEDISTSKDEMDEQLFHYSTLHDLLHGQDFESPSFNSWDDFARDAIKKDTYGQCTAGAESAKRRRRLAKTGTEQVAAQQVVHHVDPVEEIFTFYSTLESRQHVTSGCPGRLTSHFAEILDNTLPPVPELKLGSRFSICSSNIDSARWMSGENVTLKTVKRVGKAIKSSFKALTRKRSA